MAPYLACAPLCARRPRLACAPPRLVYLV